MLSAIFVDRPRLAIVIAVVTTIAGALAYLAMPVAQYPDIVPPQVQVVRISEEEIKDLVDEVDMDNLLKHPRVAAYVVGRAFVKHRAMIKHRSCAPERIGAKLLVVAGFVVIVETTNAKLRLFRVPDLLSAAFVLAGLALLSTFLFQ